MCHKMNGLAEGANLASSPDVSLWPHFSSSMLPDPSLGEGMISPVGGGLSSLVNSVVIVVRPVAGAAATLSI